MTKTQARTKYKLARKQLTPSQKEVFSLQIANHLLSLPIWNKRCYHIFLSIQEQDEVDTAEIIRILQSKNKNIAVSISNFETSEMEHFLLTANTVLVKNKFHIPEPINGIALDLEKIEVVFVPLLAFDVSGNRVGYGKGFYDIFLAKCTPDTIKIGLSFFEAESQISQTTTADITLNYCITPNKIYKF